MNKIKITEKVVENIESIMKVHRNRQTGLTAIRKSYFMMFCGEKGCARHKSKSLNPKKPRLEYDTYFITQAKEIKSDLNKTDKEIKVEYITKFTKETGWGVYKKKEKPGKYEVLCPGCVYKRNEKNE